MVILFLNIPKKMVNLVNLSSMDIKKVVVFSMIKNLEKI